MKTVGISESARGGNTEILLDIALEEARAIGGSANKITLRDKVIAQCDGRMGCAQTGECIIQDDMQEVFQQLREADGIIWATLPCLGLYRPQRKARPIRGQYHGSITKSKNDSTKNRATPSLNRSLVVKQPKE